MRKIIFALVFFTTAYFGFAQRLSTVGILPFTVSGSGVTEADAEEAVRLITAELGSWGTINVLHGNQAETGEYIVRGQISRQNNQTTLTVTTSEAASGKILTTVTEQASAINAIPIVSLCAKIAENIPFPNYLLGRWRSTINMVDGPVTCVMEFRSDRTVRVHQYDTWEHNGTNSLKYQAIGRGTYSYAGYLRRTVTIGGQSIQTDATVGINLSLEDALPKYNSVSRNGLRLLFDDSKSSFELVYGGLPCGDNYSGAGVYPGVSVFYTRFTKIE